jgi:transcription initiation factor TFIIIB Brf1 subunit/transcription initiation factor TFIIB
LAAGPQIILQTIAAADWEQGYRLSVLHNLARRVGLAGEITFAAVAGWENRDSTTVDESGRIQTKSACWREIEMIEEVLALCGAEQKEKRADFGPSWRWTWHMRRGGGATTTAVYLKVYKDVSDVDEMWIDFRPQKAFGAAPNLRSVASVSSPLGCATEFNDRLKEALSKASALAKSLGWVENYEAKARELGE